MRRVFSKKFDVVMCISFMLGETGYYLAHKLDASIVLYFTGQVSAVTLDYAMGQPHNNVIQILLH